MKPKNGSVTSFTALALVSVQSTLAQMHQPPARPAIAPLIAQRYPNDADGDRIDDRLGGRARTAIAAERAAATPTEESRAQARLCELVDVELIFNEPITQNQLDAFLALGGQINYIYKSVSYGWNGRIPLNKVPDVPPAMGGTLVLIEGTQPTTGGMLNATRTGRVRPVWVPGFAGSLSGFSGDTNITIAIIDSGVDETHTDLAGRGVYFKDFTDEPLTNSLDPHGHGSAVAGVALGIGEAGGATAGPLPFTIRGNLASLPDGLGLSFSIDLPANPLSVTATATWKGGSVSGTQLDWLQRTRFNPSGDWFSVGSIVGTSPLTLTLTFAPDPNHVYTPVLFQTNGITDYVINYRIYSYPESDDGFNRMRGVAPGCNWAAARTLRSDFSGTNSWSSAAVDDLVANRVAKNIKLINFSITIDGDPGLDPTLRQKINSAVNNGVLVVALAGNHGHNNSYPTEEISDPGRAALALTVGAINDLNQLTYYTSHGFYSPSTIDGQEEDYKPDIIAPGGSTYSGYVRCIESNTGDGSAFPDLQPNDYTPFTLGGNGGTSVSAPFAAGCAALVMQAMQKKGITWDFHSSRHALFVKMLLCATASETELQREAPAIGSDPSLERDAPGPNGFPVGKDPYEGYGTINPDAALEAVSLNCTNGVTNNDTFGDARIGRRVWARTVNLARGKLFTATLNVPDTGDFDLYLYSNQPGSNGAPVLLASSAQWAFGGSEVLNYGPVTNGSALLVVKRVSGSGSFSLVADEVAPPVISVGHVDPNNFIFSFVSIASRTYIVQYKDSLEDTYWQDMQTINGDGTTQVITDPLSPTQRFYRLVMR